MVRLPKLFGSFSTRRSFLRSGLAAPAERTLIARRPKNTPPRVVTGPTLLTGRF
jgi:hypothetical protein